MDVVAPPTIKAPVIAVVVELNVVAPFTVKLVKVPTDVMFGCAAVVTVPAVVADVALDALPLNVAVIVPALKLPLASRATIAETVFALVAVVAELLTLPAVLIVDNLSSVIDPANIPLVTFKAPIVVAFPTEVTSPVKLAFVVTVAALPEILPSNEPVNAVELKDVKPAIVVADEPKDIAVEPTVTDELVNCAFDKPVTCADPDIVPAGK